MTLDHKFKLLEMAAFDTWKAAGPEEREKIVAALGKYEAEMIIKDIRERIRRGEHLPIHE